MRIRSPATCARSGATAADATAPKIKAALERRGAPRPGGASAASCADGACGRVHAQTVRTARDAGLVLGAFAALDFPLTDVRVFHTDRGGRFDDTGIDELLDVFDIKGSLSRRGDPCGNTPWPSRRTGC